MARYLKILLLVICVPIFVSASHNTYSAASSSYDIANIYEKVELKEGSKSLDSYGNVKDVKAVFVPTKIDIGRYQVELTKIDRDFYQICGTSLYIETKYCYEYAMREDAILNVTSNYGYTRGEVIFLD
jgi:hypothetical protein